MLLRQRRGELLRRDVAALEQQLTQQAAPAALCQQHALEPALREQLPVHEDAAERTPLAAAVRVRDGLRRSRRWAQVGVEVETVLLCDDHGDVDRGDDALGDEHLPEQLPGQALLQEERLELVLVDEPALDEQLTEGPPWILSHGAPYRHLISCVQ